MLTVNARVHFIGIGGIGMSALAQVLLAKGYIVTGSDIKSNNLIKIIESKGGRVFEGHDRDNIDDARIVVYSSAISGDNPELMEARRRGLQILHRGELLAELMKERDGIAVTGAHGKTTTASMISEILIKGGYDPICILGGESLNLNGNVYIGKGRFLLAEADESDGSHLCLKPRFGIITNIDREHLDYYKSQEGAIEASRRFLENIKPEGVFFGLIDDSHIRKLLLHYDRRFATFGLSKEADLYAAAIHMKGLDTQFNCIYNGRKAGAIRLKVPGMHNVLNALASILFALHIGIDFSKIAGALAGFSLPKRRFEVHPHTGSLRLIEDYAHHPTEISAALEACRLLRPGRIVVVFQPHRYTRTRDLSSQFGACFNLSDELILTNIYAASEEPIEGVSVKNILDEVRKNGLDNVHIIPKENIAGYLYNTYRAGDLIAVLGAGDIGEVAGDLKKRLKVYAEAQGAVG